MAQRAALEQLREEEDIAAAAAARAAGRRRSSGGGSVERAGATAPSSSARMFRHSAPGSVAPEAPLGGGDGSIHAGNTTLSSAPTPAAVAAGRRRRRRQHALAVSSAAGPFDPLAAARARLASAALAVTPTDLLDLGSVWPLLSTLANAFNMTYAGMSLLLGEAAVGGSGRLLLGIAAGLDWLAIIQYAKFDGNFHLFGRTLGISGPMIAANVVGAVPVFLAFATAGTVLFGRFNERFDGVHSAAIALFAVANGDIVRETFQVVFTYTSSWAWGALSQGERREQIK